MSMDLMQIWGVHARIKHGQLELLSLISCQVGSMS